MSGPLSQAEDRVLRLRAKGLTNDEVANELGLSIQTIKNQMNAVYAKLDAGNAMEAAYKRGWVTIPGEDVYAYKGCDFIGQCGRGYAHRGQHGGFRAVS